MTDLNSLVIEVDGCPKHGKNSKRRFSVDLKKKICLASIDHGISKVAHMINISPSLLSGWRKKFDFNDIGQKEPIKFQELPPIRPISYQSPQCSSRPVLKLTAPSGHSLELDSAITPETIAIVRAFVGGAI